MPKMDVQINDRMHEILKCLDATEPRDMYEVADRLGVKYFAVYPYFRKLEEMGMITAGPFRKDSKKTFVLADTSGTPKIHTRGVDAAVTPIYKLASGAATAKNTGTETGVYVNNFPYMILRLYNLAFSVEAGHPFDRKVFQEIRGDMVMLKARMENMILACNELLAHPAMSGQANLLVDTLLGDPNNPLNRDTVQQLMRECAD